MISYKKLTITVTGLILIMVVFAGSTVLFFFKPALAAQIVSLSQVVITAISGIVAVFTGAQAAVDYKTVSITKTAAT